MYWYEYWSKKKNQKMILKKVFLSWLITHKTVENVREHRDIKLFTVELRRNYLVSEPNYHTAKFFAENTKQRYLWINLSI